MDRETFLARAKNPQTTEISIGDGQAVKARKLKQSEVEHIRKTYASEQKALEGFRYIVSRCVLNDDGDRMFSDADTTALAEIDFETIEGIAMEVMRHSGMKVDGKNG